VPYRTKQIVFMATVLASASVQADDTVTLERMVVEGIASPG